MTIPTCSIKFNTEWKFEIKFDIFYYLLVKFNHFLESNFSNRSQSLNDSYFSNIRFSRS